MNATNPRDLVERWRAEAKGLRREGDQSTFASGEALRGEAKALTRAAKQLDDAAVPTDDDAFAEAMRTVARQGRIDAEVDFDMGVFDPDDDPPTDDDVASDVRDDNGGDGLCREVGLDPDNDDDLLIVERVYAAAFARTARELIQQKETTP